MDFVYSRAGRAVPVEVKAEENLQAKSLRAFVSSNGLERGVRLSLSGYREQDRLANVPLYAVGAIPGGVR